MRGAIIGDRDGVSRLVGASPSTVFVTDASLLVNFLRIDRMDLIAGHSHAFIVTDHVAGEVSDRNLVDRAVRRSHAFHPVAQREGGDDDARPSHRRQATRPAGVPHRRPVRAGDAGMEANTRIEPATISARRVGDGRSPGAVGPGKG